MKMAELKKLVRRRVLDIEPWPAGKPIEETMEELGLSELALMATNENPLGPSPKAVEAMEAAIRKVNYYPDGPCRRLKRKVAGCLDLTEDMVTFGNGADSCIRMVMSAFVSDGEEVIIADPSFPVYSIFARVMGGEEVFVPLKDYTHDLEAMRKKISPRTKLVCICNPNNPTGSIVRRAEMNAFFRDLPSNVIVVIDEAYFEFVSDPQFPDGLDYLRDGGNVIVMRTFSKLYGLAGLRIGYMMAEREMISVLERVREPYTVSSVAEAAAAAALDDQEFVDRVIANNESSRSFLYPELERLGLQYVPSHTNFIFVDLKTDAKKVAGALLRRGVLVRPGTPWKLPTCVRITFGTEEQNAALIKALEQSLEAVD
jgi:histidinol-phosphate aminotransferase